MPRAEGNFDGDPYPKSFDDRDPEDPDITVPLNGPLFDDPNTPEDEMEPKNLRRLKQVDMWIDRALPCQAADRLGEVMISFERSESITNDDDDTRNQDLLPTVDEYVFAGRRVPQALPRTLPDRSRPRREPQAPRLHPVERAKPHQPAYLRQSPRPRRRLLEPAQPDLQDHTDRGLPLHRRRR